VSSVHPSSAGVGLLRAIGSVAGILLLAVPAASQILYGSIVGVVKDAQGAFVPGATVTIVSKETNLTRDTVTNADGAYSLLNVLPGQYDVKVSLQGFRENVRSSVPVSIGQISRVDMSLEIGTLTEVVTVASAAQLLQTDRADVSTELKSAELTAMPLNRFRNYQALVNLVPGTTPMAFGNAETDTPARSLATNVNGQANTNNSTRTDGATNMNIWLPNHNMYISPAETIDTVNVSTSSFDAEQGMAGGAAVTVVTKSGTNQFKGSAFEFFMNDKMNATPYYFGAAATKPGKLPLEQNNFGGTVGGPIARNKVFFFASFEGYKRTNSLFTFFSVPTEAMRNGDFSAATNNAGTQQIIYNPFSGGANGVNRVPFDGNRIPSNMLNATARRIVDLLYPLPNTVGTGLGGLTNNYQREETRTVDRKNYDLKLNFNRTQSHQLWAKYAFMDAVVDDLTNYLGPDPNATGDGGFTKVYTLTAGQTWTLTPSLLMDTTFGFARQKQDVLGPDFNAGNFGLDVLGIPGTNDQGTGDQRYAGYPVFNTGLSAVGNRDGWNPIFRDERTYSVATNLTKVAGRHDIRGGYSLNFLYLDHWQPESNNPRGNFSFAANATRLNASGSQASNLFNTYAAFMMGLTSSVAKSVQNELMTGREWQHALYVRDNWTVNPRLTLNLGLRWEYYPIMTRADGRGLERLDLNTLEVILGGRGGNDRNVGLQASKDNFAPRIGGVFRLNDETVLRSGYGITYNAMGWARPLRGDQEYPVTIFSNFTQPDQFMWYNTLEQGIPLILGPDQSTGRVALPNAAGMVTPEVGNVDRGMVQTWNVAFERQLPWSTSVDVAYVGAKGTGGYAWVDVNLPSTYGGGAASRPYFATFGRQNAILSWGQRLDTRYNSLQIALNKTFSRGFMFKGAYTLSKSMNESDNDGRTGLTWEHPLEQHRNWAVAGFDRTHNLQMGFAYAPYQSSGSYSNVLSAILQDWQVNGVIAAFSGNPFTITADGTSLNTPGTTQTADLTGEFNVLGNIGNAGNWFDRAAFTQPTGVRQGTSGRNQFRGPGAWNVDFALFRTFTLGGPRRLEFRFQANNVFNHAVFANPNGGITGGTFGQITAIGGGGSYPERQLQLGLRFTF
jgi:outer membrane receptor protein involved in Fe transport